MNRRTSPRTRHSDDASTLLSPEAATGGGDADDSSGAFASAFVDAARGGGGFSSSVESNPMPAPKVRRLLTNERIEDGAKSIRADRGDHPFFAGRGQVPQYVR